MSNLQQPFWMVYGMGQGAPTVRHDTSESAVAEARRLARANPGITFIVLASVRGYRTADPIVEIEFDDGIPF